MHHPTSTRPPRLPSRPWRAALNVVMAAAIFVVSAGSLIAQSRPAPGGTVSYHRQIWPILQAKCQGCHQPASAGGKLVVTSFAALLKGGEHGPIVTSGKPASSAILDYLTGT
jgi:hypothetical protein